MQDHSSALVARRQIHCGYSADALAIQDDAVWADAVPDRQQEQSASGLEIRNSVPPKGWGTGSQCLIEADFRPKVPDQKFLFPSDPERRRAVSSQCCLPSSVGLWEFRKLCPMMLGPV